MSITVALVEGPITPGGYARALAGAASHPPSAECGARLRFEGVVRRTEPPEAGGEPLPLLALDYQVYSPMAQQELESLAAETLHRHGLDSITVLHSRGRVPVGEVSFILEVTAAHRAEAIEAVADFIDGLKRDVPIWKRPVWTP